MNKNRQKESINHCEDMKRLLKHIFAAAAVAVTTTAVAQKVKTYRNVEWNPFVHFFFLHFTEIIVETSEAVTIKTEPRKYFAVSMWD